MKRSKILTLTALLMIAAMAAVALASCAAKTTGTVGESDTDTDTDNDKDTLPLDMTVLTIGDYDISYESYRYFFLTCKKAFDGGDDSYWETDTESKLDLLMADVLNELRYETSVRNLADKAGVKLGEDDYAEVDSMISYYQSAYQSAYGISFEEFCSIYFMTLDFYREFYAYNNLLMPDYYEYFSDESNALVPEATADDLAAAMEGYVRIKHILVHDEADDADDDDEDEENNEIEEAQTDDGGLSGRALAEYIRDSLRSCGDYDSLLKRFDELEPLYNEDGGMDDKNGYYMTYGEMVPEFEEAAFALEIGGVSDVVESTYGYHILIRLAPDDDYVRQNMYPYYAFNRYIKENGEKLTVTESDFYKNLTIDSIK